MLQYQQAYQAAAKTLTDPQHHHAVSPGGGVT